MIRKIAAGDAAAEITVPDDEKNGHYATNVAFGWRKSGGRGRWRLPKSWRKKIGEKPSRRVFVKSGSGRPDSSILDRARRFYGELKTILKRKKNTAGTKAAAKKIQIEFISANPTGRWTVGNGRGGFLGDSLAEILKFCGWRAEKNITSTTQKQRANPGARQNGLGQRNELFDGRAGGKNKEIKIEKGGEESARLPAGRELMKENRASLKKN